MVSDHAHSVHVVERSVVLTHPAGPYAPRMSRLSPGRSQPLQLRARPTGSLSSSRMTRLDDRPLALWTKFAGELAQSSCIDESIALLQNVVKSLKSTTSCEVSEGI
jgi:hypothetical protein